MKPLIQVQAVSQRFNTASGEFLALQNVSFDIVEGETISLIGHSGCGKSTLLNLIAGITTPTEGGLLCDNREIAGPGPERAVVFQNHSLLPWLSCFDNVALAVDQVFRRTMSKSERREWIEHNLARVQMGHALHKRPGEISGGMKQRVGIARALILALIGELKKRGSRCLTLEVRASNDPARTLYESLGFAHVGTRRNYYQNPKEDALILRKEWEI